MVINSDLDRASTKSGNRTILISVGGPSSSGKSTAAKGLLRLFEKSEVVHLDDFYFPDQQIPIDPVSKEQNWDCADAIDFEKFVKYIEGIKSGEYSNHKIDSLEPEADLKLTEDEFQYFKEKINKKLLLDTSINIVFVDGFMLYHDPQICNLFDIRLFFRASFETLKSRRESRGGYNTVDGFWVDPPGYFTDLVWPEYVKSHKYLFENENVNGCLNAYAKQDLQICDLQNENLGLFELIDWSLQRILDILG